MQFGNRKNILEDLFSSVLSQFKKYYPSGNLKFINLGIFQSLKISFFNGKKSFQFLLTHYRPVMPFGNRKIYFRGSSQFSIVTI